ncbi:hypothetical protein V501_05785 [Pseudogymnoascus sp. VKM F-4519 (FW-2642)]|nr:hypothetical protein V501_05785 [Pseudogymnoascus sp. VKM F-4519 (FW-2642)]
MQGKGADADVTVLEARRRVKDLGLGSDDSKQSKPRNQTYTLTEGEPPKAPNKAPPKPTKPPAQSKNHPGTPGPRALSPLTLCSMSSSRLSFAEGGLPKGDTGKEREYYYKEGET